MEDLRLLSGQKMSFSQRPPSAITLRKTYRPGSATSSSHSTRPNSRGTKSTTTNTTLAASLSRPQGRRKESKIQRSNTYLGEDDDNEKASKFRQGNKQLISAVRKEPTNTLDPTIFDAFHSEDPNYTGMVTEEAFRTILLNHNIGDIYEVDAILCKWSDGSGFIRYVAWFMSVSEKIGNEIGKTGKQKSWSSAVKKEVEKILANCNGMNTHSSQQLKLVFDRFDLDRDGELTQKETKQFLQSLFPFLEEDVLECALFELPFTNTYPVGVSEVYRNKLTLSFRRFRDHIQKYPSLKGKERPSSAIHSTMKKPPSSHKRRSESLHASINRVGDNNNNSNGAKYPASNLIPGTPSQNVMSFEDENNTNNDSTVDNDDLVVEVYDPSEDVVVQSINGNVDMERWVLSSSHNPNDTSICEHDGNNANTYSDNVNSNQDVLNDYAHDGASMDVASRVQHVLDLQNTQQLRLDAIMRNTKPLDTTVKKTVGSLRKEERDGFFANKPGAMLHLALDLHVPDRARDAVSMVKNVALTMYSKYMTLCQHHDPYRSKTIPKGDFQNVLQELGLTFSHVALARVLHVANCNTDVDVPYVHFINHFKYLAEKDAEEKMNNHQRARILSASKKMRPNHPIIGRRSVDKSSTRVQFNSSAPTKILHSNFKPKLKKGKASTQGMDTTAQRVFISDVNFIVEAKISSIWWKLLKQLQRFDHAKNGLISPEMFRMMLQKFDIILDDDQFHRLVQYWASKSSKEKQIPYKKFIDYFACKTSCQQTQQQMLKSGTLAKMDTKKPRPIRELYGRIRPMIENNFTSIRRTLRKQMRGHETVTLAYFFTVLQRFGIDLSEDEENEITDTFEKEGGISYNDFFRDCLK
eukprot:m.75792 g.75792  ORF g.75792 m.75792 type:complete len:864 (+) comp8496_c0_seq1:88-2679(+)